MMATLSRVRQAAYDFVFAILSDIFCFKASSLTEYWSFMPLTPFSIDQIAAILAALPDPAFIVTRSGRYAAAFGGSDLRYYHESSFLIGKTMREVLVPEKANWFIGEIDKALTSRSLQVVEYGLASSDIQDAQGAAGPLHPIWFEGRVQALDFAVDGEDAVMWVASNITARSELEAKLRLQSESDELSGLFNRRKLMAELGKLHDVFVRYSTPTSLLIFDIDHFKSINDQYGHLNGDKAIQATAEVCRHELRATDFPARFGGDEFVVLMPHTSWEHAQPIAERLRTRIADALRGLGRIGNGATVSGGLSEFLASDSSPEDVLKRADDALYQAKRDGRDRILHK
jgi:diguanylate cyclase (GGDEF)-like protein